MTRRPKKDYLIRSLDHSLDVLEALSASPPGLGLAQAARLVGLHKNSVFRLMATLEHRGFVERNNATGNYRLGLQAFECGYAYLHHTTLLSASRPALAELVRELAENATLAVLRDGYVFYQDEVAAERTVRVSPRTGTRVPLSFTATGWVFMAWMSEGELGRLVDRPPACARNADPLSPERLRRELAAVRGRGVALDLGEWEEGVHCAAAPIFDFHGKVAGALSVTAPSYRLEGERLAAAAEMVKRKAAEVSRRMGFLVGAQTPDTA